MLIYIYIYIPLDSHLRLVVLCDGQRRAVTAEHAARVAHVGHRQLVLLHQRHDGRGAVAQPFAFGQGEELLFHLEINKSIYR